MSIGNYFNAERFIIATVGVLCISISSQKNEPENSKILLSALGWFLIAFSSVYIHSKSPRGIIEPLGIKTLLVTLSASILVLSSSMNHDSKNLVGLGIAGLVGAMIIDQKGRLKSTNKILLSLLSGGLMFVSYNENVANVGLLLIPLAISYHN